MRWWLLLSMLAGCETLFPLDDNVAGAGEDEDADTIVDAEDNCPGFSNRNQLTSDSDGVGDVCDPSPSLDGDAVAAREMFSVDFGNASPDGELQVMNGAVITAGDVGSVDATLTLVIPDRAAQDRFGFTAEVGFHVLELGVDNRFDVQVAGSRTVSCELRDDGGASFGIFTTTNDQIPIDQISLSIGTKHRLVVGAHEEDGSDCTFDGTRVHGAGSARGDVTVTVTIHHMHVQVDYIVGYDSNRADPAEP